MIGALKVYHKGPCYLQFNPGLAESLTVPGSISAGATVGVVFEPRTLSNPRPNDCDTDKLPKTTE